MVLMELSQNPKGLTQGTNQRCGTTQNKATTTPYAPREAELRCLGRNKHQPGENKLEYIIFQKYF